MYLVSKFLSKFNAGKLFSLYLWWQVTSQYFSFHNSSSSDPHQYDMSESVEILNQLVATRGRLVNCEGYFTNLLITYTMINSMLEAVLKPVKAIKISKKAVTVLIKIYELGKYINILTGSVPGIKLYVSHYATSFIT